MRYPASEKLEIITLVEQSHLAAKHTLDQFGTALCPKSCGKGERYNMQAG